ncbi:ArnT family glycosyltransferase [Candidatus Omnitrophota bacterium]
MDAKKFLRNILLVSLSLHLCLLAVINFGLRPSFYIRNRHANSNDGEAYSTHGRVISYLLTDKLPDENIRIRRPDLKVGISEVIDYAQNGLLVPANMYQIGFITYLYSLIYAVFGYSPVLINLLNIMLHLLTAVLIFKICGILFDQRTGCIASAIFLFNPILFYYSSIKLADMLYIFIAYASLYFLLSSQKKKYYIFFVPILLFAMYFIKRIYFVPLLAVYLIYMIIFFFFKNRKLFISCAACIIALMIFSGKLGMISAKISHILETAAFHNLQYQRSGGFTYDLLIFGEDYSVYSPLQWFIYGINGWYRMLFEPLHAPSVSYLLYYPFKIIFLFLCFFAVLAVLLSVKLKIRRAALLSVFFVTIGSIIALGSGNVGTMLRHRDIITPIIFIFSSAFLSGYFRTFR